jgi:hypothetical protein
MISALIAVILRNAATDKDVCIMLAPVDSPSSILNVSAFAAPSSAGDCTFRRKLGEQYSVYE